LSVPHSADSVTITFSSNLDEDAINESWGIRDFTLSVVACDGNCSLLTEEFFENTFDDKAIVGWSFSQQNLP